MPHFVEQHGQKNANDPCQNINQAAVERRPKRHPYEPMHRMHAYPNPQQPEIEVERRARWLEKHEALERWEGCRRRFRPPTLKLSQSERATAIEIAPRGVASAYRPGMLHIGRSCMDWVALRSEFPVTRRWAFFDHAAVAPLSGRAQHAMTEWATHMAENGDAELSQWERRVEDVRR